MANSRPILVAGSDRDAAGAVSLVMRDLPAKETAGGVADGRVRGVKAAGHRAYEAESDRALGFGFPGLKDAARSHAP